MTFVPILVLFSSCTLHGFVSSATTSPPRQRQPVFRERFRLSPDDYAFEEAGLNRASYDLWDFPIGRVHLWKDKLFVTQSKVVSPAEPRIIPLAYINLNSTEKSPKLIPYPKELVTCISRVYTLEIDSCDRLWFIDSDSGQLYIVDLNRNKIIRDIRLKSGDYSYILSVTVDVNKSDCDNAYAYMVDSWRNEILVYKYKEHKYWATGTPTFARQKVKQFNVTVNPLEGLYYDSAIADLHDGNGSRRVLFLQLSKSDYLISVATDILRNSEKAAATGYSPKFTVFGYRPQYSFSFVYFDERNSILFFKANNNNWLGCWNTKRFPSEFSDNTTQLIMQRNWQDMKLIRDIQSDDRNNLLIVTKGSEDYDRYIIYLYTVDIKEMVKDTVCDLV